ncbi:uncharacterized membrane protein YciS (DUF1049 family) [Planomicrobium stackebrandtii]|uniref:Uncharacterized membrane protein YciS (DUF1049 family) n=1 Tax=Planomicrobium stackebrandtii TaxID=253160 RepID=A0ABU0GVY1_9BACL|nr:LapA family protein [Planomicrobium stackebrandtii]MDQ0429515.1 uncharacterized membrane protein YciS (DUF1049 family) [Planomicrobium stackebrandtii]
MEKIIALSPILLMVFLAGLIIVFLFFMAKSSTRSVKITEYEKKIQALEEENQRLKNSQDSM